MNNLQFVKYAIFFFLIKMHDLICILSNCGICGNCLATIGAVFFGVQSSDCASFYFIIFKEEEK